MEKELEIIKTDINIELGATVNIYGTPEEPMFKSGEVALLLWAPSKTRGEKVYPDMGKLRKALNTKESALTPTDFITEKQYYKAILKSNSPVAEPFYDWLSEKVLPSIRKHNTYISDTASEEDMRYARENSILELINDGTRAGRRIKEYAKTVSPDELLSSLIYIYDKVPTTKRGNFLKNIGGNIREIKDWYRKSDEVEDFNALSYERYNVVLLYIAKESEKFHKRSLGHKLGAKEKQLNNSQITDIVSFDNAKLGFEEDRRIPTIVYTGSNYKRPSRSARFNMHKIAISAGLYKNKDGIGVCISDGVSYRKYGWITDEKPRLVVGGNEISYDKDTHEIIVYKPTIVYENK